MGNGKYCCVWELYVNMVQFVLHTWESGHKQHLVMGNIMSVGHEWKWVMIKFGCRYTMLEIPMKITGE